MDPSARVTRDGLTVGFIAYASVAAFYSIFDFLAARGVLHTVNMLGRAVFRDLRDPAVLQLPVRLDASAIFLYNGLHLGLSLLIGLVVVRFISHAERHPSQARLMLVLIVAGFLATILAVGWLSTPIRPVLPWWSIVAANTAAVAMAAIYLVNRRPGVAGRLMPAGGGASR
jgi:hypothetical protein